MNTITLSLDRYPIEKTEELNLEYINFVCTWIFVGEMIIKILGLGATTYAADSMNQFDAVVVIISIAEMVLESSRSIKSQE